MIRARRIAGRPKGLGLALCCGVILALTAAAAQAAGTGPSVERMLAASGKMTPQAVAAVRDQYTALKRVHPGDARIDYGYGLALVNQHRYEEALEPLRRYRRSKPNDLSAASVLLWAELHARRYDDLLRDTAGVAAMLRRLPADVDTAEFARRLGVVVGYLELVRPEATKRDAKDRCKAQILAALNATQLKAFDEGRRHVESLLEQLESERNRVAEDKLQATLKQRDAINQSIDRQRDTLSEKKQEIRGRTDAIVDSHREAEVLQLKLASLDADRTKLAAQIMVVQAQISELQTANVTTFDNRRKGDTVQTMTVQNRLSWDRTIQIVGLATTLAALNKQAFEMDREILSLQSRGATLSRQSGENAQRLERDQTAALAAERKAAQLEKQLKRLAAPNARGKGPTGKMLLFSTYEQLPFAAEQQRVLDWFSP